MQEDKANKLADFIRWYVADFCGLSDYVSDNEWDGRVREALILYDEKIAKDLLESIA